MAFSNIKDASNHIVLLPLLKAKHKSMRKKLKRELILDLNRDIEQFNSTHTSLSLSLSLSLSIYIYIYIYIYKLVVEVKAWHITVCSYMIINGEGQGT